MAEQLQVVEVVGTDNDYRTPAGNADSWHNVRKGL